MREIIRNQLNTKNRPTVRRIRCLTELGAYFRLNQYNEPEVIRKMSDEKQ